jgi:IS30 family transposase
MKINLWYCKDMNLWRWTLVENSRPVIRQESGQQSDLRLAMNDIANTVEYLLWHCGEV